MVYTYESNADKGSEKDEVKRLLLQNLPATLKCLLPKGVADKDKFCIGNIQGDLGKSLVVELGGPKAGLWRDFATGQGGDILHLWAAVNGLDIAHNFPEVLLSAQKWLGIASTAPTTPLTSASSSAIPSAPATTLAIPANKSSERGVLTGKWTYPDENGNPLVIVSRYDYTDGKKKFFPHDVKTGKPHPPEGLRPLYNLPGIKVAERVVVVEGEKAAQALIDAGICATTAMNGANTSPDKTDWSPLKYKEILIWPDNDEPGQKYAEAVVEKLKTEILHSLCVVKISDDKPEKWDAADAVAEQEDINAILSRKTAAIPALPPLYDMGHAVYKTEPVPTDLVGPRILTEGGFCLIGGAPKAGKSDFLMHWLAHMATGRDFLGMTTPRPLRVVYLQSELRYHFICERIKLMMKDDLDLVQLFKKNFFFTPHMKMTLDQNGVELMRRTILYHFRDNPVDVIAIDPLRYVFDGGPNNQSENDNTAMRLFLRDRADALRDSVNPNAANILVHHTKKISTEQLEDEEFQALSGAGVLHGHFSTGILLYRPDKTQSYRKALFVLRDGDSVESKYMDKTYGKWHSIEHGSSRLVAQEHGCKLDAEHRRKQDVIVQLIRDEAYKGNLYTMRQFCRAFGNGETGLGSPETIRLKLNMLATNGHIKFLKDAEVHDIPKASCARQFYLCIDGMEMPTDETKIDPITGKVSKVYKKISATHSKSQSDGEIMKIENPAEWINFEDLK